MILNRNEIPTSDVFSINYLKVKNVSDNTHSNISSALNSANIMYNNSSVMEDIILEDFLSLYTQAKDVNFAGRNKNRAVESFLTTQLSDGSFHVDNRLNIDTQNGNIILPVLSTFNVPVTSIVVESDSNGSPGDSFSGGINSDINVILDSQSQAIFEYEKVASSSDSDNLMLTLMFELDSPTITNGMYIKLFAPENGKYPSIDIVDASEDGVKWNSIKNFGVTSSINKADYFLRFLPQNVKYVRLRLIQDSFESKKTIFGYRYRYLIGIREVTFKQIEYDNSGDYVSIPFSTGRPINSIVFRYSDVSNNDVKYKISGNNGGKWIDVPASGSTLSVTNENAGVYDGNEIRTIRVKVSMDKTNSVLNKVSTTEYLSLSPNNKYYLKQAPVELKISCGRHISFGREIRYQCERQVIPSTNFLVRYVPYDKAILVNVEDGLRFMRVYVDGVLQTDNQWTVGQSDNPNNCEINFVNPVDGNAQVAVDFKEVKYKPGLRLNQNSNIITLPVNMFYDFESDIVVKAEEEFGNPVVLSSDQYQVISRNQIKINNSAFKKDSTYYVSFTPAFEINNSYKADMNQIEINSMYLYTTTLRFDYTYQNVYDISLNKYYTPIGQEYTMEIQ